MPLDRQCEQCGQPFKTFPYAVARGEGRFCSHRCAARYRSEGGQPPSAPDLADENTRLRVQNAGMLGTLGRIQKIHRASSPKAEQFQEPGHCAVCQDTDGGAARWPCETRRLADIAIKTLGEQEE